MEGHVENTGDYKCSVIDNAHVLAYNCNWHASPVQADAFCISSVCTAYGPGTSQLTGTGVSVVLYFTAIVCPS